LRFRLGPDVAIALGARVKVPGEANRGQGTELQLVRNPGEDLLPYERLLGDALHGDATLFARDDVVREQWRIVEPALGCNRVHIYEPGTWGPLECNKTVEGFDLWHDPEPAARS
jgi:glucose-6-phosphate 1-dehydrogenase